MIIVYANNKMHSRSSLIKEVIDICHFKGNEKKKLYKYRQLLSLYYKNQTMMTTILMELWKYCSFKSYFYILCVIQDDKLENLIFDTLLNVLHDDEIKYNEYRENEISNLAKWLPRENAYFDNRLNFVNRFVIKYYPELFVQYNSDDIPKHVIDSAKKKYRHLTTNLNKCLNTLETIICSKNGSKIDYATLNETQINKYFYHFCKNDETNFLNFIKAKYLNMGINIVNYVYAHKIKSIEENNVINDIFSVTKYSYYNKYKFNMFDDYDLFVDFSQKLINNNICETLILIYYFLENKKTVYINGELFVSDYDLNICTVFNKMNMFIKPLFEIAIPKNNNKKNLVILTNKKIQSITNFEKYSKISTINFTGDKFLITNEFKKPFLYFF
jgi:hypothetical protein